MGVAMVYAVLQKVFHVIAEIPAIATSHVNKYWPAGATRGEITPEYLGVGYIIGPRISGVLVAGSVLAWWALIPLLTTLGGSRYHCPAIGKIRISGGYQ